MQCKDRIELKRIGYIVAVPASCEANGAKNKAHGSAYWRESPINLGLLH